MSTSPTLGSNAMSRGDIMIRLTPSAVRMIR